MLDRRLRVLRVVAATGSVTAAARVLQYTPSAVSHQVKSLADELGVPLLAPHGRGVRLTPAGLRLAAGSDELAARWEAICAEAAAVGDAPTGTFRLCGFSTAAAALLPHVVTRLRQRQPQVTVRVREAGPGAAFDLLLAAEVDLAVVVATAALPPVTDPRFDQHVVLQDPLDLLVAADHQLAGRTAVSLADAAGEPWIVDSPGSPYRQLVETACAAVGFSPSVAHEVGEWDTGAALVDHGLGIAVIPRLARIPAGYRVSRVALHGDPSPARTIVAAVRAGSRDHPLVAEALDALDEISRACRAAAPPPAGQ